MSRGSPGSVDRWTIGTRPAAVSGRVVCLPYGGGTAATYGPWRQHMPEGVDLVAVQLPGRHNRIAEPLPTDLHALADVLAEVLAPLLDVPAVLFGHSMGALLAYEVTGRLVSESAAAPRELVVSGAPAPALAVAPERLSQLPDPELAQRAGLPPALAEDDAMLALVLPALRADFAMCERYAARPWPPLPLPITVLGGDADPNVGPHQLAAWSSHTCDACSVDTLPGEHLYLLDHVADVSAVVLARLDAHRRSSTKTAL